LGLNFNFVQRNDVTDFTHKVVFWH